MGEVLHLPHVRTPADSGRGTSASAAKASKVISPQPRSVAKRTMAAQRWEGMPRSRQVLTVERGNSNAAATAAVPPRASITESGVSMPPDVVRTLRTCQGFANCETTFLLDYGPIGPMIDPPDIIGKRLVVLRTALEFKSQKAFADRLSIEKNTYNPFEKGTRPLTFEVACTIRKLYGVPLDWLFFGADPGQLPARIYNKIAKAA